MPEKQVSTQAELEQAIKDGFTPVIISDATFEIRTDITIRVGASSQPRVVAYDSSQPRVEGPFDPNVYAADWKGANPKAQIVDVNGGDPTNVYFEGIEISREASAMPERQATDASLNHKPEKRRRPLVEASGNPLSESQLAFL